MARKANGAGTAAPPPLKWNTTKLTSSYANFCNANSTREEVVLNFGVNKNWERGVGTGGVEIDLNHRIVLSPFAAKRLTHGTPAAAHEGVRGALRGARRVGIRSRPCAIAFAVACLSGCGTKSAELNAFLGPPPGTVYVYKRIGEIHQRVTCVEGISTPGPASVLVRMQTRDATDRPEQVRVLGAATQSEFAVQGGALVERHLGAHRSEGPLEGNGELEGHRRQRPRAAGGAAVPLLRDRARLERDSGQGASDRGGDLRAGRRQGHDAPRSHTLCGRYRDGGADGVGHRFGGAPLADRFPFTSS